MKSISIIGWYINLVGRVTTSGMIVRVYTKIKINNKDLRPTWLLTIFPFYEYQIGSAPIIIEEIYNFFTQNKITSPQTTSYLLYPCVSWCLNFLDTKSVFAKIKTTRKNVEYRARKSAFIKSLIFPLHDFIIPCSNSTIHITWAISSVG